VYKVCKSLSSHFTYSTL